MARVVLAMSGGVDSSVAAHLLLEAGHEVIGVFMRHGEASAAVCQTDSVSESEQTVSLPVLGDASKARRDHKQGCCTASDAADARRVAQSMKIPFYAIDLQEDFRRIVDYFVDDYLNGRTPNPCVRCNQWIKFDRLYDYADDVDAEFVATGHYAQMRGQSLHRGEDDRKDQSYALFGISRHRLPRMLLPVGGFEKPKIREIAESLGMGVASKKDSQEICFVTQGHHSDFIRSKAPDRSSATAGEFVWTDGSVIGQHEGFEAFTVGQRKGLGIALGKPVFVVRVEPDTCRVVLGDRDSLKQFGLLAKEANWLVDREEIPENVSVQIRYNAPPRPAKIQWTDDDGEFQVTFDEGESAIAPGQAAVVYKGTQVLGGGWIDHGF